MSIQILENHYNEQEVVLIGINGQGFTMAQLLRDALLNQGRLSVILMEMKINKVNPVASEIQLSGALSLLDQKSVIIVDDVMNTGRTQAYGLSHVLQRPLKRLETAVLVNRSHTLFPITASYTGFSLSTTLEEHIEVKLQDTLGAFLY
jgi:pyrimidine operon attenuation protein/uracil phosphoribosyltransferase